MKTTIFKTTKAFNIHQYGDDLLRKLSKNSY